MKRNSDFLIDDGNVGLVRSTDEHHCTRIGCHYVDQVGPMASQILAARAVIAL